VGFVVEKVALGLAYSEYFGFCCQCSFHQILHSHNHPLQVQQTKSGRRASEPSMDSTPHYANKKKLKELFTIME
jgi:hypothetical protein